MKLNLQKPRFTVAEHFPQYDYPASEHYVFPADPHEQVDEELRLYPTPQEFRENAVALKRQYADTPIMRKMEIYARFAAAVRTPDIDGGGAGSSDFNHGFYSGALLATHVNAAPATPSIKRAILRAAPLPIIDIHDDSDVQGLHEYLRQWAGQADGYSWADFMDEQTDDFQDRAMQLGQRLYDGKQHAAEREFDFVLGYTLASGVAWMSASQASTGSPV